VKALCFFVFNVFLKHCVPVPVFFRSCAGISSSTKPSSTFCGQVSKIFMIQFFLRLSPALIRLDGRYNSADLSNGKVFSQPRDRISIF
jgi:hypothetical protein